ETGGKASGTTIFTGSQVVLSAASATGTIVSGGTEVVSSGGTALGATIAGGVVELSGGGVASGAITFVSVRGKLKLDGTDANAVAGATISGLVLGETIDLAGAGFASGGTAQVMSGNVLHIVENGHTFDIHLDPTANYSGTGWHLVADGGTGTNVSIDVAPILSGVATSVSFTAGQTVTLSPSVTVTDPDDPTLASATVAITGGTFAGDDDVLAANVAGTSITASYNSTTETLVLSGTDTLAHYQQVLDSVTF